jgi:hypothetical protein
MMNFYAASADLIVVVHFLVLTFVLGSQVLILLGWWCHWSWIRKTAFRITHLILVVFITVQSLTGNLCPLTIWEYRLRLLAGQVVEKDVSFMARVFRQIIFYDLPGWTFNVIYVSFGILVIMTFVLIPPEIVFLRREKTGTTTHKHQGN